LGPSKGVVVLDNWGNAVEHPVQKENQKGGSEKEKQKSNWKADETGTTVDMNWKTITQEAMGKKGRE